MRKSTIIGILCMVAVAVLFAMATTADDAEAATITVNGAGGGDHTEIQDAINASAETDTILVYNGTYTCWNGFIEVNKTGLRLASAWGSDTVFITCPINITNDTVSIGVNASSGFTINQTAVDASTGNYAISFDGRGNCAILYNVINGGHATLRGNGTVNNITITGNTIYNLTAADGALIWLQTPENVTISSNTLFSNTNATGIYFQAGGRSTNVHNNSFYNYSGGAMDVGIYIYDNDTAGIVHNNTIYTNSFYGQTYDAIRLHANADGSRFENIGVKYNTINYTERGVVLLNETAGSAPFVGTNILVSYNDITTTTLHGIVTNVTGSECGIACEYLDARYNWWGNSTGPHVFPFNPDGVGETIDGYVNWAPWYNESYLTGALVADLWVDADDDDAYDDGETAYSTIPLAIAGMTAGTILNIAAGIHGGNISASARMDFEGAGYTTTIIDAHGGVGFTIATDWVNVTGLLFYNGTVGMNVTANFTTVGSCGFYTTTWGLDALNRNNLTVHNSTFYNNTGNQRFIDTNGSTCRDNVYMNATYGLYLYESYGNTIYHNDFVAQNTHAYDDTGSNYWDAGWDIGGNYWDDWTTPDYDNNGYVDTPRSINGSGSVDNYPFTDTRHWNVDVIPSSLWTPASTATAANATTTDDTSGAAPAAPASTDWVMYALYGLIGAAFVLVIFAGIMYVRKQ